MAEEKIASKTSKKESDRYVAYISTYTQGDNHGIKITDVPEALRCATDMRIFAVAKALHTTANLYHVSSDFLAATCPKEWDFTGNLLGDKAATVVFDCSKLKRAVPGFCATTRFDEGVRRCVDYILAHPELQEEDPEFDAWCDKVIKSQEEAKNRFQ